MAHTFITKGGGPARLPEDRRGTRSHCSYAKFCASVDKQFAGDSSALVALLASRRINKKAQKLLDAGRHPKDVQGRVVRACMRSLGAELGQGYDHLFYGHP